MTQEEIIKALWDLAERLDRQEREQDGNICAVAAKTIMSLFARAEKAEAERDNWKDDYHDAVDKLEAMEERAVKAEAELKEAVEG